MPAQRVGILPSADRQAIFDAAKRLQLDPYEFGAFLSLESGPNMDPNIVGGAGGRHKGLIQFGQNEQKMYGIAGPQTRAGQIPKVLQYFEDRGYKPGMGIARAYATVLGGNPNVSLQSKDSFGTSVAGVLPRFKPGGDLYKNAQRVLGDLPTGGATSTAAASTKPTTPTKPSAAFQNFLYQQLMSGVNYQSPISKLLEDELLSVLPKTKDEKPSYGFDTNDLSIGLASLGFPSLL